MRVDGALIGIHEGGGWDFTDMEFLDGVKMA